LRGELSCWTKSIGDDCDWWRNGWRNEWRKDEGGTVASSHDRRRCGRVGAFVGGARIPHERHEQHEQHHQQHHQQRRQHHHHYSHYLHPRAVVRCSLSVVRCPLSVVCCATGPSERRSAWSILVGSVGLCDGCERWHRPAGITAAGAG
jgi:hypothetical protein